MNKRSLASDKVTIKIPRPLYEKLAAAIDGAGYDSVTDFVVYVLRDIVSTHGLTQESHALTESELATVKERLRSLGYL
ncbi:MAG: CopG family transcriptional regulator [Armatimonadetes bacterium]|nr:CopG family transcriptional regulator [Armatimonadota bacterium]